MLETVPKSAAVIRRRRQCLNPRCGYRFTTTESQIDYTPTADEAAVRAQALMREFGSKRVDKEALRAALTVDLRRAAIARAQRATRRADNSAFYEPTFDPAPAHLTREELKRELGEP